MKSSEKAVCGVLTVLLGVLFIALQGDVVSVAMTLLGAALIVWGVLDLFELRFEPSLIKIVAGAVIVLFGWLIVGAVLYILAAALLALGAYFLYVRLKNRSCCASLPDLLLYCAPPVVCMLAAFILFFNQGCAAAWVFIVSGVFIVTEGGLLLWEAFRKN